ncbi:MAG: ABC transporter permease [Actinomycetia bacterium]|nr:ABC transporter permease [Actinomycetes bacterium]
MTGRLFLHELRAQQRLFWRTWEATFFTFLLPIIFLAIFGAIYGDADIDGTRGSTFLLGGMIGFGIAASAFGGLAITVVLRRESGLLKRIRGTPLPPWIHLGAMIGSVLIVTAISVAVQLVLAHLAFDADLPGSPWSFAIELLVGTAAFAALGLAITGFVRSAEGSSAIVNAIYLPMTFISGAWFSTEAMPTFLQAIAEILPLTHLLRLLRGSIVSGETVVDHPTNLIALAAWGVIGLVLALRAFRWEPRAT